MLAISEELTDKQTNTKTQWHSTALEGRYQLEEEINLQNCSVYRLDCQPGFGPPSLQFTLLSLNHCAKEKWVIKGEEWYVKSVLITEGSSVHALFFYFPANDLTNPVVFSLNPSVSQGESFLKI